ncbi:MAG: GNAT family N-acetyltransferase [Chloroflexi bacterium]|nr:GNAT family N-acetyltransferase [Chloroflexota bacterium]
MTKIQLPQGYTLRAATMDDLEAVVKLVYDVCEHDGDTDIAYSPEELKEIWEDPNLSMEKDTWVISTETGYIVGYEEFYNRSQHAALLGDGYVHPNYLGIGIGTALLRALDIRAREEIAKADPKLRVFIRNGMSIEDTIAREMHENEGYKAIRFYWRMEIELEDALSIPALPKEIELRPFDEEAHAELVYKAHQESFKDHWGFTPISFKEWKRRNIESSEYRPELWFVAWDGDQIAGYAINHYKMDNGWVHLLGVRKAWRKRGLGLLLLKKSFSAFYERDTKKIGLGVDAASQTGATRLYKRAGMSIGSEYVSYEKELRPGREIEE